MTSKDEPKAEADLLADWHQESLDGFDAYELKFWGAHPFRQVPDFLSCATCGNLNSALLHKGQK